MEVIDGSDDPGQWLADPGWLVGADGSVAAAPAAPSAGLPQPTCPGSRRAIFFVLRTGCQWGALSATGICSKAQRRFTEWVEAGVFHEFWRQGLLSYDRLVGIEGVADGAMAPLGGEKTGPNPGASWGPSARW